MTRVYLDTEFIEDGHTIELLSIGLFTDDNRAFYAEPAETDRSRANEWVREHVLPQLGGPILPRREIAEQIVAFVGDKPEFWGYYADYDWVALCQLYGTMMDLPNGWPMYCRDLKQWCDELGNPRLPEQGDGEHNAFQDAFWNRKVWEFLAARASSAP
jgi:hypothetical protein